MKRINNVMALDESSGLFVYGKICYNNMINKVENLRFYGGNISVEKEVLVAIIGAAAVVLAAIISGLFNLNKNDDTKRKTIKIRQKQKGKGNTQIGIQNNYVGKDEDKDD